MAPPKSILKKPSGPSSRKTPIAGSSAGSSSKTGASGSQAKGSASGSKKPKQSISLPQKKGKKIDTGSKDVKKISKRDREEEEDDDMDGDEDDGDGFEDDEEMGTDEEIERAQSKGGKVKPAVKRKRPTTADEFGSALTSLLSESTRPVKSKKISTESTAAKAEEQDKPIVKKTKKSSAQPILALSKAKLPPTATTEKLERQAARAVKREKEEKEDRARVKDVVEGWSHSGAKEGEVIGGQEFEKGLRKTAQRGVIKLFNAILTASRQEEANGGDDPDSVIAKTAEAAGVKGYGKKDKGNVMGRGGKEELTKEGFLDLVKRGSGR